MPSHTRLHGETILNAPVAISNADIPCSSRRPRAAHIRQIYCISGHSVSILCCSLSRSWLQSCACRTYLQPAIFGLSVVSIVDHQPFDLDGQLSSVDLHPGVHMVNGTSVRSIVASDGLIFCMYRVAECSASYLYRFLCTACITAYTQITCYLTFLQPCA